MKQAHVTMVPNGRLVIPAHIRAAMKMERGGAFVARIEDGAIKLEPLDAVIRKVQANVRRYVPEGSDLAADLNEDRRREAGYHHPKHRSRGELRAGLAGGAT